MSTDKPLKYPPPLDLGLVGVNVYEHGQKLGKYAFAIRPHAEGAQGDAQQDLHDFISTRGEKDIVDFFRAVGRLACARGLENAQLIWVISAYKAGRDEEGSEYKSFLNSREPMLHMHAVFWKDKKDINLENATGFGMASYCPYPKNETREWAQNRGRHGLELIDVPSQAKEAEIHQIIALPRGYKNFIDFSCRATDGELSAFAKILDDAVADRMKTGGVRIVSQGRAVNLYATTRVGGLGRNRWFQKFEPA